MRGGEKTKILILSMLLAMVATIGTAIAASPASPDILIHPDADPIPVGIDPNAVSPPLDIEYTDWGVNIASWSASVSRDSDGFIPTGCSGGGTISGNDFHVTMSSCKIPASDVDVKYKVNAEARCPSCAPLGRSRLLIVDANVIPTPEVATGVLLSAGLIGLVGLSRYRKK